MADFQSLFTNKLAAGVLGVAMLTGGGQANSQTRNAPQGQRTTVTAKTKAGRDFNKVAPPEQLTPEEIQRRSDLRDKLLEAASDNYNTITQTIQTPYSQKLLEIAEENKPFQTKDGKPTGGSITYLDPFKLDMALALGIPQNRAAEYMLLQQGLKPENYDMNFLGGTLPGGFIAARTALGTVSRITTPSAHVPEFSSQADVSVVVPAQSPVLSPASIGMTQDESAEFVNRHEGFHCDDDQYPQYLKEKGYTGWQAPADYELKKLLGDPKGLDAYSTYQKMESFADVGAMGEEIRHGADIAVIDKVIKDRTVTAGNLMHFSPVVLQGLKDKITEIGIDNFRRMDANEAKQFYYDVTNAHGLNPQRLETLIKYEFGTPEDKAKIAAAPDEYSRIAATMAKLREPDTKGKLLVADNPYVKQNAADDAARKRFGADMQNWDASKILQDTAFSADGKITPETLMKAYGNLQTKIGNQLKDDPDKAPLYQEQMVRLRNSLVQDVPRIDYVAINAARGVDIEKVEPVLKAPATKPETATGPKA